jgi:negative regulator of sigma E activity
MNAQQNNTTTYSTAELLRYLDGRMDRGELLALERAMLDDEMLADSVEGYRLMRETLSDEAILERAFNITAPVEKKKEKEIAPVVPASRFRWLGYAAAASLIVAAGWWVFSTTRPDAVLPTETNDLTNPAFVSADPVDTVTQDKQAVVAESPVIAATEQPLKETEPAGEKKTASQGNDVAKLTDKNSGQQPAASTVFPEEATVAKTEKAALSDAETRMRTQRIAPEVVTSERHTVKFSLMDSSIASPVGGWNAYREYLGKYIDLPNLESPSAIEISLGAASNITGVSVQAPIGDQQKASIIKTIQNGPAWKNKSGKAAKATIQFQ